MTIEPTRLRESLKKFSVNALDTLRLTGAIVGELLLSAYYLILDHTTEREK